MEDEIELIIRRNAELDISDVFSWYEEQQSGLGDSFLHELKISLDLIKENPKSYFKIYKSIRRAVIKKFPYGIFYMFEKKKIIVIACFHFKRHPKNWKNRL